MVFASSGGAVYGPRTRLPAKERASRVPPTPYGISKKIVEDYFRWYAENHNMEYLLLAPANIYGPRQNAGAEGGVVAVFCRADAGRQSADRLRRRQPDQGLRLRGRRGGCVRAGCRCRDTGCS